MKANWDDLSIWHQALLMAFDQVREFEEAERELLLAGAKPRL